MTKEERVKPEEFYDLCSRLTKDYDDIHLIIDAGLKMAMRGEPVNEDTLRAEIERKT